MKKIIDGLSNVIEKTGEAFDRNFTSKEEVLQIAKETQGKLLEIKQSIILAEATGTKMQRNWRPTLMYVFGFIIAYDSVIAPILNNLWQIPRPELTNEFWDVLQLSIGGYVIGRSSEKVLPGMANAAKNLVSNRKTRRNVRRAQRKN